jgi:hypothetical protein
MSRPGSPDEAPRGKLGLTKQACSPMYGSSRGVLVTPASALTTTEREPRSWLIFQ